MATVKTGRLIDHLHLRVRDLEASRRFYKAIHAALGIELDRDEPDHFVVDELYVDAADDYTSRVHLAFQGAAARRSTGSAPPVWPRAGATTAPPASGTGHHGAFLLDPDGSNIEAVFHGPSVRSAAYVEIKPAD